MYDLTAGCIRLVAATVKLLDAEEVSADQVAKLLLVKGPPSWPPLYNGPDTRQWVRTALLQDPAALGWFSWYMVGILEARPTLAGIAGFKGPPDAEGAVEIGYSVVTELQRRGLARAAVDLLCRHAFARGALAVIAETLPELEPSQRVLANTGFEKFQTISHSEIGEIWRYKRRRPTC
jgi:RimJ/RimL family protein N-acetyltransferase